jgi:F-type H+-transporting ATPase subunit b
MSEAANAAAASEAVVDHSAHTEVAADHGAVHAEPTLYGLEAYQVVSIAMLVLVAVMIWKKVPGMITGGLDAKIAAIRAQLDEAKALRAEAEALRNEYAAKIANAEKDAEAMLEGARREADGILAKAEADSTAMVARRTQMAEDKIGAAEREAIEQVRAKAASAAAAAAGKLIADKHDAEADSKLADEVIAGI